MKGGYFLLNGQFHKEQDAAFSLSELKGRAEGFSEIFRAEHNEILFSESIGHHLQNTAQSIGADLTELIGTRGRRLRTDVSRLLNKNKLYLSAKIEMQFFRCRDRYQLILSATEVERDYYPIQEPGLILSFYTHEQKEIRPTSSYASDGLFFWQGALRKALELQKPNLILLNKNGICCESIWGSFAVLNKDGVFFPSATSGGYRCAILEEVIQSAREAGFPTFERDDLKPDELLEAEELLLFDACNGIQKVLGLEERRYYSTKSHQIALRLSELARRDREEKG